MRIFWILFSNVYDDFVKQNFSYLWRVLIAHIHTPEGKKYDFRWAVEKRIKTDLKWGIRKHSNSIIVTIIVDDLNTHSLELPRNVFVSDRMWISQMHHIVRLILLLELHRIVRATNLLVPLACFRISFVPSKWNPFKLYDIELQIKRQKINK